MSTEAPPLLRPLPRRAFDLTPLSSTTPESQPSPDWPPQTAPADNESSAPPSRSRSILNLTSSTLFGIYSPAGYAPDRDEAATPWGTGAETPVDGMRASDLGFGSDVVDAKSVDEALARRSRERRGSMLDQSPRKAVHKSKGFYSGKKRSGVKAVAPIAAKTAVLGVTGVLYGVLISHLHDERKMAPVPVDGLNHYSAIYLGFWGVVGVALGWLMPWVDRIWAGDDGEAETPAKKENQKDAQDTDSLKRWVPVWSDVVRSLGSFVGIAYAIRRLPWQSTLQLSLTLALANPWLWFMIDRTPPGFILSTTIALSGTALLLGINPDLVPSPSPALAVRASSSSAVAAAVFENGTLTGKQHERVGTLVAGLCTQETVAVATWIASVLFVSAICFGNIGRRLLKQ